MSDLNRCMLLRIPEGDILQNIVSGYDCIMIRRAELPEGYQVASLNYDHETRDFIFKIHHQSFQPVEPGQNIPFISTDCLAIKTYKTEVPEPCKVPKPSLVFCTYCHTVIVAAPNYTNDYIHCPSCKTKRDFEKVRV
jgi:hypothetical protein